MPRCPWAKTPLLAAYHDAEWGVPTFDERALFEHLVLSGVQAGLSWEIVLRKRDAFRRAFAGFRAERVARYDDARIARLLADPALVRNRAKLEAAVVNARAVLELRESHGGLAPFLWGFVDHQPVVRRRRRPSDVPARTPLSDRVGRELKARGFRFVGPTICYAMMQAVGMVNDHLLGCPRHAALAAP